jgi:RNA polymerase sigma-70 factor (ECF subfamily)
MPGDSKLTTLLQRIRAGDAQAANELVREYEPAIRRIIRARLTDARLRRTFDSMDICQSVMANFFVRTAAGQFDLQEPEQLLKLLATMAKNKLLNLARDQQAARRDQRRIQDGNSAALMAAPSGEHTPSQIVSGAELLAAVLVHLSDEERFLAEQRAQGRDWAEIAAELNSSPEALRKKLARAMDRVTKQLGIIDANVD